MKPNDRYQHRESGAIVTIRSFTGEEVRYSRRGVVWAMPVWELLEAYEPAKYERPPTAYKRKRRYENETAV